MYVKSCRAHPAYMVHRPPFYAPPAYPARPAHVFQPPPPPYPPSYVQTPVMNAQQASNHPPEVFTFFFS
mgnify:CR=1 FL=1